MARRRFQDPKPQKVGHYWYVLVWENTAGPGRKRQRIKLAPADTPVREVRKIAAERLRSINTIVMPTASEFSFESFVTNTYEKLTMPLLASSVQRSYRAEINKYVLPVFGRKRLRDLSPATLQEFFIKLHLKGIEHPTLVKLRDALSSVLRSAVKYDYLASNPMEQLELPPDKRGRPQKPWITPAEFLALVQLIPEPYSTVVLVAGLTALRVSELLALKWKNIHSDSITIEQRYCRGDWSCTKTPGSASVIAVDPEVLNRIQCLKTLTVDVRAGRSIRHHKVVKSSGPDDLVFQALSDRMKPMNDGNIMRRFIRPAAKKLGLKVNWQILRRSCGTWMVRSKADLKSVQAQMRHSRIGPTMDIYAQFASEGQLEAVQKLRNYVESFVPIHVPIESQNLENGFQNQLASN